MAKRFPTQSWTFMNYGYSYLQDEKQVDLKEEDEINRYSIQLYHSLLEKVDHESKEILEVGSGRGGGSNYIATTLLESLHEE